MDQCYFQAHLSSTLVRVIPVHDRRRSARRTLLLLKTHIRSRTRGRTVEKEQRTPLAAEQKSRVRAVSAAGGLEDYFLIRESPSELMMRPVSFCGTKIGTGRVLRGPRPRLKCT